jgi:hypothetical protein
MDRLPSFLVRSTLAAIYLWPVVEDRQHGQDIRIPEAERLSQAVLPFSDEVPPNPEMPSLYTSLWYVSGAVSGMASGVSTARFTQKYATDPTAHPYWASDDRTAFVRPTLMDAVCAEIDRLRKESAPMIAFG